MGPHKSSRTVEFSRERTLSGNLSFNSHETRSRKELVWLVSKFGEATFGLGMLNGKDLAASQKATNQR
jgi:hypothetical protein